MRSLGLQRRFAIFIIAIFLTVGVLAYLMWNVVTTRIIQQIGTQYALRTVTWQTEKTEGVIDREVTLAQKLAHSPLLQQWSRAENDPQLTRQALAELESYRELFRDKSTFFIIDQSRHYYYSDDTLHIKQPQLKYTLNAANANDKWYFTTMRTMHDFALNVDHSEELNTTKVWINVILNDGQHQLGMAGTGIDLTDFLNTLLHTGDKAASVMLFDERGNITASLDSRYLPAAINGRNQTLTPVSSLISSPSERQLFTQLVTQARAHPHAPFAGTLTIEGRRYMVALAYMPNLQWFDMVLIRSDALLSLRQFLPLLLLMVCAFLGLLVGITVLVQRLVLRPLARLTSSAQSIAQGDYNQHPPVARTDEIGVLTHSFNQMSNMVKAHTENLEQLVSERTEALRQSNTLLAETHLKLMDSIAYATVIQRSVLPSPILLDSYFPAHFAIWLPRDSVGGDAYFAHTIDDILILALVDCTGHGVPGALMTMSASALFQHHLANPAYQRDPAGLLQAIHVSIRQMLAQHVREDDVPTGMEMAICCYSPRDGQIIFAGARISLWLSDGQMLQEITGDRQCLGYGEKISEGTFQNHTITVHENVQCYLTTDGWLDQSGTHSAGCGLGRQAFRRLLERVSQYPMQEQEEEFLRALRTYQGNAEQRDDITLLGFTISTAKVDKNSAHVQRSEE